ncbi:universal stress protein [Nitratireductor sp. XY-223]|uniref:universal stress protein n=1 Tax=Nitratireductor sp. XY-223 TaxID=2561926 RepID=UPI0010A9C52B|nr:universal stress protein [Nitratireductor sp. XY-223]
MGDGTFKSILLPIDLASEPSWKRPLNLALELAVGGAMLHVMTVVPDFGMSIVGSYFDEGFEKNALDDVAKQLEAWTADHVPDGVDHRIHVAHGTIYAEILRVADELQCDAIVMAAHRPELKDYLLGPNAARVMRHAGQSVLVVRD